MRSAAILAFILPFLATSSPVDLSKRQFCFPGFFGCPPRTTTPSTPAPTAAPGGGSGGGFGGFPGFGGGSNTARDVENGVCRPVTLIFARGTSEGGNIGTVIGPPFISSLKSSLGSNNVAAQGVNYPADSAGNFPGGNNPGPANMVSLAQQAVRQCPDTQLVLSGYSQGASVTHNAISQLDAGTKSKVKAVVVFGDPYQGQSFSGIPATNVKSYCAQSDPVCRSPTGNTSGTGHLSYGGDANSAAAFVKTRVSV